MNETPSNSFINVKGINVVLPIMAGSALCYAFLAHFSRIVDVGLLFLPAWFSVYLWVLAGMGIFARSPSKVAATALAATEWIAIILSPAWYFLIAYLTVKPSREAENWILASPLAAVLATQLVYVVSYVVVQRRTFARPRAE